MTREQAVFIIFLGWCAGVECRVGRWKSAAESCVGQQQQRNKLMGSECERSGKQRPRFLSFLRVEQS